MTLTQATEPTLLAPERPAPQWMHYGDMIRILGTIAVVFGHVSDMILYQGMDADLTNGPGTTNWYVANWWDAANRWAVPIYIMLSGSLLLDPDRQESPSKFYRKRLMRIGIPLVFWSLFFMWVDVYYTGWRASHDQAYEIYKSASFVIDGAVHSTGNWALLPWDTHTHWQWFVYLMWTKPQLAWINLLKGQPYMHMHFIFRIAGLYAFTPVLRVCLRHISRSMLVATVVTMLALSSADSVANNVTGTSLSAFARFVPFLGFYLLGYLLRTSVIRGWKLAGCWAGLALTVYILAEGTKLLVQHFVIDGGADSVSGPPSMSMMLYDFLSPVRVVMAVFAWLVLVNLFRRPWPQSKRGQSMIRFWANTTLGLYLIHPLFREILYMQAPQWMWPHLERILSWHAVLGISQVQVLLKQWMINGVNGTWPNIWVGIPLVSALVYVPALISTIIIMRIPYIRRVAG